MTTKIETPVYDDPKGWLADAHELVFRADHTLHPEDHVDVLRKMAELCTNAADVQAKTNYEIGTPDRPTQYAKSEPAVSRADAERLLTEVFGRQIEQDGPRPVLPTSWTFMTASACTHGTVYSVGPEQAVLTGQSLYPDLTTCPTCRTTVVRAPEFGDFCSERCRDGFYSRP